MKEIIQHPVYGEIIYNENIWTGKKALTVNGINAQPISKKEYMINEKKALLKGSYLTGTSLSIEGDTIQLSPKTKWYEMVFAILPFLFLITWGNNATLCSIFPVVGGALGGVLGGIALLVSLFFMKKQKTPLVKVLIGAAIVAITILVAFILAFVLIQLVA